MTDTEILKHANANLWFLREGDYLPELLQEFSAGRGVKTIEQLNEMRRIGTVYPTRETASIISSKVRALLGQANLECLVSTSKHADNGY